MKVIAILIAAATAASEAADFEGLYRRANRTLEWQRGLRRELHRIPELNLETYKTAKILHRELTALKIKHEEGWASVSGKPRSGAGIVGEIGTGKAPFVLLRSDTDALPIREESPVSFASVNGNMHACGHDMHMAVLLGALRLLKEDESSLKGTVRFMLQPAEETGFGAAAMVREGVVDKVSSAFSMHVMPMVPTGTFIADGGLLLVGGDHFEIVLEGKSGHAGVPLMARDPVVAAAALITEAQTIASRETFGGGPTKHVLLSFTQIYSNGTASNAIPERVELRGTMRSGDMTMLAFAKQRLQEMLEGLKLTHRVNYEIKWRGLVPALYNDMELAKKYASLMEQASRTTHEADRTFLYAMEDFSHVSSRVPALTVALGIGSGAEMAGHPPTNQSLHNSKFVGDERMLPRASALFATLAERELRSLASSMTDEL